MIITDILWGVFNTLSSVDFQDADQFASSSKTGIRLSKYLKTRQAITLFIQNNVGEYKQDTSRLTAFNKWLDVADVLFLNGCYEGFWVVMTSLLTCHNRTLEEELDELNKSRFARLMSILSPSANFGNLRRHLKEHPGCFVPVPLWCRDLTALDNQPEHADDGTPYFDVQARKQQIFAEIDSLINANQPQNHSSQESTSQLLELIRQDLITQFMQKERKTTGLFGGEYRTVDGVSYRIPLGIAQIYDVLTRPRDQATPAEEVLLEVNELAKSRQNIKHGFFNQRQTITHKFLEQCTTSISHLTAS